MVQVPILRWLVDSVTRECQNYSPVGGFQNGGTIDNFE